MASEEILKELFKIAKTSNSFKGMPENEIWDACLAYKDRSDDDIRIAIDNIQAKDREFAEKSEKQKELIEKNKEKISDLRKKEQADRQKDTIDAEKILDNFFKL